jgi:hypothetical protein
MKQILKLVFRGNDHKKAPNILNALYLLSIFVGPIKEIGFVVINS